MSKRVLLCCAFLLALLARAGDGFGQTAAARVLVAVGEVSAIRGSREVPLVSGAEVFAGDTIRTGELSNAQLGFSDSSVVALRARTQFRIDEYQFDRGAGSGKSAFSLVRGGLRTLTGLLGKAGGTSYRVNAAVATLGIRGTHYTLLLCQQDCTEGNGSLAADGAYGGVFDGAVVLSNAAGEREFATDEYFHVPDANTPPRLLPGRPGFLRDRLEARQRRDQRQQQALAALREAREERDDDARSRAALIAKAEAIAKATGVDPRVVAAQLAGVSAVSPANAAAAVNVTALRDDSGNIAVLGPGLGLSVGFTGSAPRSLTDGGSGTVIALSSAGTVLERFRLADGEVSGNRNGAGLIDSGNITGDGSIHWGRWGPAADVTLLGQTLSPGTGVHFVFGNLTPPDVLNRPIATIGVGASAYDYVGGTNPTHDSGASGQFLGGIFNVDFLARTISGGVSYRIGQVTFTLPVPTGTALQARPGVVGFLVTPRNGGSWSCACNNTSGTLDSYAVSGLFMGSRAQGLGVTFATLDQITGKTAGAAVFRCRTCKP
ncbi:MAG TPA: FecR family protein [Usitatibacteraceae bacterium]|nr:FecR family protein [Usitatibacteraceae bacterium]